MERDERDERDERGPRDERETGDPRDAIDQVIQAPVVDSGVPKWVKRLGLMMVIALVVAVVMALYIRDVRQDEDQRDCVRSVALRDDARSVWMFLVAREPDRRDDPDVVEFVAFLDDRLPELRCVNRIAVPIGE